jgi:hypothetical protein
MQMKALNAFLYAAFVGLAVAKSAEVKEKKDVSYKRVADKVQKRLGCTSSFRRNDGLLMIFV